MPSALHSPPVKKETRSRFLAAPRRPSARQSLALSVVVLGLMVAGALLIARDQWQRSTEDIGRRQMVLANVLEEDVSRTFDLVENAVEYMTMRVRQTRAAALSGVDAAQIVQDVGLFHLLHRAPFLRSITIVDGEGLVLSSTDVDIIGRRLLRQAEFAGDVMRQGSGGLAIGKPQPGRDIAQSALAGTASDQSGRYFIPITRSVQTSDSKYVELIAVMNPDFLMRPFEDAVSATHFQASLATVDGTVLVSRGPAPVAAGASAKSTVPFAAGAPDGTVARFTGRGVTGADTLGAYAPSPTFPLVVLVEQPRESLVADFRDRSILAIAFALGLFAGFLVLAVMSWRGLRRGEIVERALTATSERALASEQRNRAIQAAAPDAIISFDGDFRIVEWNAAAESLTGWTRGEVIGKEATRLIIPQAARPTVEDLLRRAAQEGQASQLGGRTLTFVMRSDGTQTPVELALSVTLASGEATYTMHLRDTRAEREAAEALRTSERKQRRVLDSLEGIIFQADRSGVMTYLNLAWQRATRLGVEETLGHELADLVTGEDRSRVERFFSTLPVSSNDLVTLPPIEVHLRTAEGAVRLMQIVAQPLTDADGKVVGVAGMLDDVTAKRAAEIRLRDQLSFNRKLIETIPVPVSVRDAEAGFVAVNRAWEQFFGKTREEVLGRLATEVFPPSMTQAIAPIDAELLRSGGHRQFEADMHVADGSIRTTLNCRSAFAREDGSIGGIITAFIDISERKKVEATIRHAKEQAEAANAAKNDFLATVSHELRTPLSGIIGMSALVLDSELNAEQRDSLEVVQTSADTLLHIIDDIRDVARIESGEIQLENRPLDLRSVASSVVRMLAVPAHVKALSIVADVTESVPQTVEGDLHRLRQVLVHLVGNAVQFTEQGEVVLEIDTCPGGLRFTIRDTGVGMPEGLREQVERLFTGRSDLRDKTHVGGALGITVSGRLVRFIGGNEVCVQSTPGGGTNIGFRLPFDADTAPAYRPVQYAGSALIVVGSPRAREALERMLRSRGLQVRTAGDPTEAVAMNQSAPADLALVDADWTGDAGPLTAQMLHRTDPTLPVFVLLPVTGPASDSSRLRQQKLAGYVRKPVFAADLERALSAVLQVRRADVKAEELPAGRPERTDSTAPAPAAAVSQANILVAEDNKVNQAIIRRLLQNAGHRVFIAGDGQRAIEALLSQRFHLILMDVQMPHMDGLEATRRIRSMEREGFPRTPIIALTAHAFGGDRELCLEAGMDGYVSKPINASVLQKVMQQHLPGSAAGDSSPRVAEQSKLEDLPQ